MQRFYLICAAMVVCAGQLAFELNFLQGKQARAFMAAGLSLACAWSLWESRRFIIASRDRTSSAAETTVGQLPENISIMDHSYGLFSGLPPYFSNGVVNPRSEFRLIVKDGDKPIAGTNYKVVQHGQLTGTIDANPGIINLSPSFHLMFGCIYKLNIAFAKGDISGVLQFHGSKMFREYGLPSSGQSMAFGSRDGDCGDVDLWTSDPNGDFVTMRFIPNGVDMSSQYVEHFGTYSLSVSDGASPVTILSIFPLLAITSYTKAALLETPRVDIPGYSAYVDQNEVQLVRSPFGLVAIPISPGNHKVFLIYAGTLLLKCSYWTALIAWLSVSILGLRELLTSKNLFALSQQQAAVV